MTTTDITTREADVFIKIYIAHKERACFQVKPMDVAGAFQQIQQRMEALERDGKVCITLDSEQHPNLVYIVSPRPASAGAILNG